VDGRRDPRRIDWCGSAPERAGSAQRKWMREHPVWPSASCVTAHFGSWSEAAGLKARSLTFDVPVAERVAEARRLHAAGLGIGRIAAEIGVSRSSAANYVRASRCPQCGAALLSPSRTARWAPGPEPSPRHGRRPR
jgi:hypothetical protein